MARFAFLPREREALDDGFGISPRSGLSGQTRRHLEIENTIQSGDSLMDVVPSIIVLAITTLLVCRRELTTPRAKKGAPRAAAARPSTAREASRRDSEGTASCVFAAASSKASVGLSFWRFLSFVRPIPP